MLKQCLIIFKGLENFGWTFLFSKVVNVDHVNVNLVQNLTHFYFFFSKCVFFQMHCNNHISALWKKIKDRRLGPKFNGMFISALWHCFHRFWYPQCSSTWALTLSLTKRQRCHLCLFLFFVFLVTNQYEKR